MEAVIKTGGKQYFVTEGDVISVEKIDGTPDTKIVFDKVLLINDDKDVVLGTPTVKGANVEAKIVDQTRAKKVWGMKYKPKKRYRLKFGHKQPLTTVEIVKISA